MAHTLSGKGDGVAAGEFTVMVTAGSAVQALHLGTPAAPLEEVDLREGPGGAGGMGSDQGQPGRQPAAAASKWRRAAAFVRRFYLQPAAIVPAAALGIACTGPLRSLLVPQEVSCLGIQVALGSPWLADTRGSC